MADVANQVSGDRERELAAQAWCDPEASAVVMDVRLANAFSRTLARYRRETLDAAIKAIEVNDGDSTWWFVDRLEALRDGDL